MIPKNNLELFYMSERLEFQWAIAIQRVADEIRKEIDEEVVKELIQLTHDHFDKSMEVVNINKGTTTTLKDI